MFLSPYTHPRGDRCPVCGALGACPDGAGGPVPHPFDLAASLHGVVGGPLLAYRVTVGQYTTVMQLNVSDAARYGSAAVLI